MKTMKKFKLVFTIFSIFALSACTQTYPSNNLEYTELAHSYIKLDTISIPQKYTPYDFISLDSDTIIATDCENDCLLIIDKETGEIKTEGSTGNDKENYLNPHGIWLINDFIYVMDSGNMRIKILDTELKYQKDININNITLAYPHGFLNDISVDKYGNIFFTVYSPREKEAKLYYIENGTNEPKVLINKFMGIVTSYEDKTYCANIYEFQNDQDEDKEYAISGEHYIYEIENLEITSSYKLPNKYTPAALYTDGGELYCSSLAYREVSKVDLNEMRVIPLFSESVEFDETVEEVKNYGSLIYDNESWWLVETNHNVIYRLQEE